MFDKFARSWNLVRASASVLRSDKELLVFPLISALAAIAVALSFALPIFGLGIHRQFDNAGGSALMYGWGFLFYLAQYFVIFFFNTALVGAAMIRLDGGDPTVADGLRIARGKIVPILGYAAIAATVGLLLRALEEKAGFIGRIVIGLIGVAWTVATFLTVPVLVARDIGPIDAVKESAALLQQTWGENLIGNGGIGLAFGLVNVAVVVVGVLLVTAIASQGLATLAIGIGALFVLLVTGLALTQAALAGIYSAALYCYATQGDAPGGFDGALLEGAFARKT